MITRCFREPVRSVFCLLHHKEMASGCLFCAIIARTTLASLVFEDASFLAFLDHRPVFPGHCLLVPKTHLETMADLPADAIGPLFEKAQLLAVAVERALGAEGSFVAVNNRVSQSVPHLHVHVVPRRRKDGLRGFFWPRTKYRDDEEVESYRTRLASAIESLKKSG